MNQITKTCEICGNEFDVVNNKQKYCSKKCKNKAYQYFKIQRRKEENERKKYYIDIGKSNLEKIQEINRQAILHGTTYGKYVAKMKIR